MAEKISFFPLDITYKHENNKVVLYIYGKYKKDKVCVVYDKFKPYLLAMPKHGRLDDALAYLNGRIFTLNEKDIKITAEKTDKIYGNKAVEMIKIFTDFPGDIPILHKEIKKLDFIEKTFEYDIKYVTRFIIDNDFIPLQEYTAVGEFIESDLKVRKFMAERIIPKSDKLTELKVLAFDIETYPVANDPSKYPILMISLYGKDFKKVLTWQETKKLDYLEILSSEKEMLERFVEIISQYKPDVLCGYYSDGFDMPFIKERANVLNLNLDIGLNNSSIQIRKGRSTYARIEGIVHIDVFKFIRYIWGPGLNTNVFDLNSVAKELLNDTKKELRITDLKDTWDKEDELTRFVEYNLHDSRLAYELCKKILPQIAELVKLTKMPLFDASRARYSKLVEAYLSYESVKDNRIIPKTPTYDMLKERRKTSYQGAYVHEPKPGFYENIAVFDFSSLYPSIITAFNISPETLNGDCRDKNIVPGKPDIWFCRDYKGFIPRVMTELITRRQRIKEMLKTKSSVYLKARSYAIKTIANAMYGYLGFFAARWYCSECADSITAYGRHFISDVIKRAEENGFRVIYGDTDSVFIHLGNEKLEKAVRFVQGINAELPGMMELTFQGFYLRGIFVELKQSSQGAKKKYALIDEKGNIVIKGFETVRRNWSELAKEVQKRVIEIILKENDVKKALNYVRNVINKINKKALPNDKFIIRTQLKKTISSYESIGPHVAVAKKLKARGIDIKPGDTLEYIITEKHGSIADKAYPVDEVEDKDYDSEYYVKNQIIPGVSSIFKVLGIREQDLTSKRSQSTLSSFME